MRLKKKEKKLARLKGLVHKINDVNRAATLLEWDQETNMPRKGSKNRAEQIATLKEIAHEKFTSREFGGLLGSLKGEFKDSDDESNDACLIRVLDRDYQKARKVSPALVFEIEKACSIGKSLWNDAKNKSNFAIFSSALEKIVELKKQYAKLFAPYDSIYDPLLNDFEPGLKTSEVKKIFDLIKPELINLLQKIAEKEEIDDSFFYKYYNDEKQWFFLEQIITRFGFDWNKGRLDRSSHPTTLNFGVNDVRMSTRMDKNYLPRALLSTLHVAGYSLYEQGISPELNRTPLALGASISLYESQSRLWGNKIGRSLPFWKYYYPQLQTIFPENLSTVTLEDFYRGMSKVKPSLVRTESDEITYNLHIMVRFEIELELMQGNIKILELPSVWKEKMKKYLGIYLSNDANGVLQDMQWASGNFGVFASHALGNIIASQLWEKIEKDIPDIFIQIENAQFSSILNWLRKNIHTHGAKFEAQKLIQKATGSKIDPAPYIRQLKQKYEELYAI